MRFNVSFPDDLHAEIKDVVGSGDIESESVSGFLAVAARRALAYIRDARTMDELFGPATPEELALVETMRRTDATGNAA